MGTAKFQGRKASGEWVFVLWFPVRQEEEEKPALAQDKNLPVTKDHGEWFGSTTLWMLCSPHCRTGCRDIDWSGLTIRLESDKWDG
jgi:hypothetical protein